MKKNFLTILTIFAILSLGIVQAEARVYMALASMIGLKESQNLVKDLLQIPPSLESQSLRSLLVGPENIARIHNPLGNSYRAAHVIAGQIHQSPMKVLVAVPMFSVRGEYVGINFQIFVESGTQVVRGLDQFPRDPTMKWPGMAIEGFQIQGKPYRVETLYVRFNESTEKQINDLAQDLERQLMALE